MKKGFSMIELIFVIVILGILASVAVPKMVATRTDAQASSIKSDFNTILSSVQSFYFSQNIFSIVQAVPSLSSQTWNKINDLSIETKMNDSSTSCIKIAISREDFNNTSNLYDSSLTFNAILVTRINKSGVCKIFSDIGLSDDNITLKGYSIAW